MSKVKFKKKLEFQRVDVDGTMVNFPFSPYDIQRDYMGRVLQCCKAGQNGLLESPTGTGKTLSLLCASLAWLEQAKASRQLAALSPESLNSNPQDSLEAGQDQGNLQLPVRHKIIYSSRTHSQLSQAVAELGRTSYRYMRIAILGSRDQLCVNPAVMAASSSGEKQVMCQARVRARTCIYKENVEKSLDRQELRDNEIMDIEDLHKLGQKHSFCPYYMSKELYKNADVIFLPYNYLLDHKIRASLNIDFKGAVIIFDEAHNVQKLCEETASVGVSSQDIATAIKDVDEGVEEARNPAGPVLGAEETGGGDSQVPQDLSEYDLLAMKRELLAVEAALAGLLPPGTPALTKPGNFVLDLFSSFRDQKLQQCLTNLVEFLQQSNTEGFTARGRGVARLLEFLNGAIYNSAVSDKELRVLFKVHVSLEEKKAGKKSENTWLNLWCFSPGFSMQRLADQGARSIILTSGTLSPLAATAEEVGLPFPVQLESKHIVTASQVWCGVLGCGPDGTILNSSFNTRSDPKYLNALGQIVIMLLKIVPKGVLVFFPSYGLLNSTREFWQREGIWTRIDNIKKIVVEPQKKEALSTCMRDYYSEVRDGPGGCFMAVCRGKVAEGLDFADDNGRAVLVTGLPYPPYKDARVELKRQFLEEQRRAGAGSMTGQRWYQLEAFRATNQAVGRVIRHSRDHGAVIFLDTRFGETSARQALSTWLQPFFTKYSNAALAIRGLAQFFKADSALGRERREALRRVEEAVASAGSLAGARGVKRPRPAGPEVDTAVSDESLSILYSGGPVAVQAPPPTSMFAPSSERISFSRFKQPDAMSSSQVEVAAAGKQEVAFKKKIKMTSNITKLNAIVNRKPSTLSETEERNLSLGFVKRLKKLLTDAEMTEFKSSLRKYKEENTFETLIPMLKTVILTHRKEDENILKDFRSFVKPIHSADYELFCKVIANY